MNEDFKALKRVVTRLAQFASEKTTVTMIDEHDFTDFSNLLFEKQELIHRIYYSPFFYSSYNHEETIH